MSLTCCDCHATLVSSHEHRPPPKRCDSCKKKKACRNSRQWALANPDKIAARNASRRKPDSQCVDCGSLVTRSGTRGPLAKRCLQCHLSYKQKRNKERYASRAKKYTHKCQSCGECFDADRKHQKTCSAACRAKSKRTRFEIECANARCKNKFHITPSQYAKGGRCCSDKCKHEHSRLPDAFCQNRACGKKIDRRSTGPRGKAFGKDCRKYCCRECAWDHRWGADRPRRNWSKKHLAAASAGALQTSLRKKCKLLGVPYDKECTRLAVLERDGWICQLCNITCNRTYIIDKKTRRPDWRNAEHDHIVPLTAAGSLGNVFPNSQCLCRTCNNKKRTRSWGQLRLDLEGFWKRWENVVRGRRQRNSRSSGATLAAVL